MLKLLDQNLLSTKTGHNYWKYSTYNDVLSEHIELVTESIKNSKDDHIRIFRIKKNKIVYFFFCIGYNDTRAKVISVYTIPNENIASDLYINNNWNLYEDPYYWRRQDPKPWNDIFRVLKLEDCPVLKTRS